MPLLAVLLLANLAGFALMAWDKRAAIRGARRVPERRLLAVALLGGSVGTATAGAVLRHKTRKQPFATRLRLILALHAAALVAFAALFDWKSFA